VGKENVFDPGLTLCDPSGIGVGRSSRGLRFATTAALPSLTPFRGQVIPLALRAFTRCWSYGFPVTASRNTGVRERRTRKTVLGGRDQVEPAQIGCTSSVFLKRMDW
jgi:hypothetical protein